METRRFKPLIDKMFWYIWIPMSVLMLVLTVISVFEPITLFIIIPTDIFVFYFLVSSLVGYVELREDTVFVKFGFIMKREIPYKKIRGFVKERKFYSESMLALKNALDHVNIKYNTYDVLSVSVVDNDELISEIEKRMGK